MKLFSTSLNYLSIASWNVNGLKSQLYDNKSICPDFIKEIESHHIVSLLETHCAPNEYFQIDGYVVHQSNRQKSGNVSHGGISVLVKKEISCGIKIHRSNNNDILWLQLKKEHFNLLNDVYLGAVYMSPINSSYTKKLQYDTT